MKYSEKLKDPRWQRKRLEVLNRDDFTCQACGDKKSTLAVHHKKYNGDPWAAAMDDLETLCENCHTKREKVNKVFLSLRTSDAIQIMSNSLEYAEYNGKKFKSLLHATWAAFFDIVGWEWEYEPYLFDGEQNPDFSLRGHRGLIIVEVSDGEFHLTNDYQSPWLIGKDILLLGNGPRAIDTWKDCEEFSIGFCNEPLSDGPNYSSQKDFGDAVYGRYLDAKTDGYCHCTCLYDDRITGSHDGGARGGRGTPHNAMAVWETALKRTKMGRG